MSLLKLIRGDSENFKEEPFGINQFFAYYISFTAILFSGFQLYTAYFGVYTAMIQRPIHLAFVMSIGFFVYPFSKTENIGWKAFDVILAIVGTLSCIYIVHAFEGLILRQGAPTQNDIIVGIILFVVLLELGRRVVGWPLPLLCILGAVYALFGNHLPGILGHRGLHLRTFVNTLSLTTEGIFGTPLGVAATFVFMFVLFGVFLGGVGGGAVIMNLARCLVGNMVGGSGKAAVIASGMFGTISGSAVANVMASGSMTIPLMKKAGYQDYFAGAVVAVAATGGIFSPPIMGAVAFIAAEFMQVTYAEVVAAALIPAILYYASLFVTVDLRARKMGLKESLGDDRPQLKAVLKESWIAVVPLFVLLYFLMYQRNTPLLSSFWATLSIVVILFLREKPRNAVFIFFNCLISGAKIAIPAAVGCALAGIIVGVMTRTGVAMRLTAYMVGLAGESVLMVLIFAAVISLVTGLGLTATIAYIIPAMMVVPILVRAGVPSMSANFFVLYFAIISYITPPVALSSYAAATIAESNFWKTCWTGFRLGLPGFIIPFMVVYSPSLVLIGTPSEIMWNFVTAVAGIILMACSLEGWFNGKIPILGRVVLFTATILLISPDFFINIVGIILALIICTYQWKREVTTVA